MIIEKMSVQEGLKKKLTTAQLQEKLEVQEEMINKLMENITGKDDKISKLESKVSKLEGQVAIQTSIQFVRDRVTEELKLQLENLQQYTRRYSVVVSKVKKSANEKEEVKEILKEAASSTSFDDVDKFHRIGPVKNNEQDLIIRFKSHSAKESFFNSRKNVKRNNMKIRPSLAPGRKKLLEEAREVIDDYESNISHSLKNPPHFVYSDMHGNLKLKMKMKVNNKWFYNFSSINDLISIIENNQEVVEESDDLSRANDGDQ